MLAAASKTESLMYVGTYTGQGSEGIYAYRFDSATGAVTPIGLVAKSTNPSFLAVGPGGKTLYAVSEGREGTLTSYTVDRNTGKLTEVNHVSTKGGGPCFVGLDHRGRTAMIANYGSGSVASYRVKPDGHLSEAVSFFQHEGSSANPTRQKGPHAHSINASPDDRFAVAADLGLDELKVYKLNAATAELSPNDPPFTKLTPGDGPRHFAFHPNKRFAYAINEMHNTVTALAWDGAKGTLTAIESVPTIPADFKEETTTAEVQVHPNGKWLYGSNRGHDSIAVFDIDGSTGKLKPLQHAPTGGGQPRNFRIDPTGQCLIDANMNPNHIRL
jgi:6-phosphogluconolactonase